MLYGRSDVTGKRKIGPRMACEASKLHPMRTTTTTEQIIRGLCAATCSEALQAVCFEQQGVVAQQALLLAELHELFCWAEPPEETPRQSVPRRCIKTTLLPEATRIKTCECVHARARQGIIPCPEVLAPLALRLEVDRSTWLLPLLQQPLLASRKTPKRACCLD